MTKNVTLSIPDISCGHCVMRVENATKDIPGVLQVQADAATKSALYTIESDDVLEQVRSALIDAGYPAE